MKTIDVDKIQPDPLAAALASTDKDTVTVLGYICAVDKATICVSETRDGTSYIEYPRSAVVAAFTDEKSDQVTLLVEANARVKAISAMRAGVVSAKARAVGGAGCGSSCTSRDGDATCCCPVGERCVRSLSSCECQDAHPRLSGAVDNLGYNGVVDEPGSMPDFENDSIGPGSPFTAAENVPGGPSTVPPGYDRKCKRVPYWVCVGKRCWIEYAWVCTYRPLPRAQFA